jgi:uncharacterized protein YecT (DUF1311 family)
MGIIMLRYGALVALLASPLAAQDLSFRIDPTETCLWDSGHAGEKRACIGLAANACMEQPGGSSTVGMGFCLDQELGYWDGMLNDAYGQLMQAMRAADDGLPAHLAIQASSLRDMQRAWIPYRDARCSHEAALWQGGTGASPAYLNCLMQETGEQALYLGALFSGEG